MQNADLGGHDLFVHLTRVVSDSPTEPGEVSPSAETLITDLILEWRTRRGIDTDATHATRVGCAEQLENALQAIREVAEASGTED